MGGWSGALFYRAHSRRSTTIIRRLRVIVIRYIAGMTRKQRYGEAATHAPLNPGAGRRWMRRVRRMGARIMCPLYADRRTFAVVCAPGPFATRRRACPALVITAA